MSAVKSSNVAPHVSTTPLCCKTVTASETKKKQNFKFYKRSSLQYQNSELVMILFVDLCTLYDFKTYCN